MFNVSEGQCKEDHPHAYGDKNFRYTKCARAPGSSPRVWGQVVSSSGKDLSIRIIPTRMGTRLAETVACVSHQDHPHAYGDKSLWRIIVLSKSGSSPRVWGQVVTVTCSPFVHGIIPTRMGTSLPFVIFSTYLKDHPHAYGDKKLSHSFHKRGVGSSPRVWGQVVKYYEVTIRSRIIPTRMGTSGDILENIDSYEDHPHAYGDKSFEHLQREAHSGSSPRVWGQD